MGDVIRSLGHRWGVRTIRNGEVRFAGVRYAVSTRAEPDLNGHQEPPYEGQLDGMRGRFYKYPPGVLDDLLTLHSIEDEEWPGSNCIDGYFAWTDWYPVIGQVEFGDVLTHHVGDDVATD